MSTTLKVGDALPSVGLRATDGFLLNLRSFVTKGPVLLLFFGGPTLAGPAKRRGVRAIEALVAGHERLHEAGIAVAAVSTDSEAQQSSFVEKAGIPFLLLSDERRSAVELLGIETASVGGNVNVTKPVALAVDRDGAVRAVLDPVEPDAVVDQALRALSDPLPVPSGDAPA